MQVKNDPATLIKTSLNHFKGPFVAVIIWQLCEQTLRRMRRGTLPHRILSQLVEFTRMFLPLLFGATLKAAAPALLALVTIARNSISRRF